MPRHGAPGFVLLVFALASLAAASIAHAIIEALDAAGLGADAYAAYTHVAIVPLTGVALFATGAVVLIAFARRIAHGARVDVVTMMLRSVGAISRTWSTAIVTAGGLATLIGMAFFEQTVSLGHIVSLATALGGVPLAGVAIVASAAFLVISLGLALLRSAVGSAIRLASVWIAWVTAGARTGYVLHRTARRNAFTRTSTVICTSQNRGSRPPPSYRFVHDSIVA